MRHLLSHFIYALQLSIGVCSAQEIASVGHYPVRETGLPLIRNYVPSEFGGYGATWSIVQDSMGRFYVGNGMGVSIYDGVSWDVVGLPNLGSVLALAIDTSGKIFVGGTNELGYLQVDSLGQMEFVSLKPLLQKKFEGLDNIRKIFVTPTGVIFASQSSVFRWDGQEFYVWEIQEKSKSFYANDDVYLKAQRQGLMKLSGDRFELVSSGNQFKDQTITAITSLDDDQVIVATTDRLYFYDGYSFELWDVDARDFFNENLIYSLKTLSNGDLAIGSYYKGLLIIDSKGRSKLLLDKESDLQSNQVTGLFVDRDGMLWVNLYYGVSKIEYPSPFSFFGESSDAPSFVEDVVRYRDKLYIASSEGLYYIDADGTGLRRKIKKVEEDFGAIKAVTLFREFFLVATSSGIFQINSTGSVRKILDDKIQSLLISKIDSNRLFVGLYPGLTSLYYQNGLWKKELDVENMSFRTVRMTEDINGSLWLSINKNEVARVDFNVEKGRMINENPSVRLFSQEDGLSTNKAIVFLVDSVIYVRSGYEVHRFDRTIQHFDLDSSFFERLGAASDGDYKVNGDDHLGNIWFLEYKEHHRIEQFVARRKTNNDFSLDTLWERRMIDLRGFKPFPDPMGHSVWYRGNTGLVRHDLNPRMRTPDLPYKALISRVICNSDSLLFGGYGTSPHPRLTYRNNTFRFIVGSTSYYHEEDNTYQFYLEGFDAGWSDWTYETTKDYTNLSNGDYCFHVRSKNLFGVIGDEDQFCFSISPPWYLSWWMYLLYIAGGVLSLVYLVKWRSKELRKRNIALEAIVVDRTDELNAKNALLKSQTKKLVQLSESKTRLYNNIAHEFRTPLTVIQGMADALRNDIVSDHRIESEKSIAMIERNGQKLLRLVNEMLDLAKLESGKLKLELYQADVIPFVKYLCESFQSLGEKKNIVISVHSEVESLFMDFDSEKISTILSNLLSNAVKFTEPEGDIDVTISQEKLNGVETFCVAIRDSGKGIDREELTAIFDRFYQSEVSLNRVQMGTGIGLALSKELVDLMGGDIVVQSEIGQGSTFTMQIPIYRQAPLSMSMNNPIEKGYIDVSITPSSDDQINDPSDLSIVLIIEDNADVAHYLKICLEGKYQILNAIDGKEGIEVAFERIPDIIISDVMMPNMDGYQVCEALKSDSRTDHIPIILLTAKAGIEDRLTGLSSGADAYLAKPFLKEELLTRLDQLTFHRKKLIEKLSKQPYRHLLEQRTTTTESTFVKSCVEIIHREMNTQSFDSTQLAQYLFMSESQVYRKLKAVTGKSVALFIRSVRLQKGHELLQTTSKTVAEVAYEVGFNNPSWFSKTFKEEFGLLPSALFS